MNKIQDVVANYEDHNSYEKARVPDADYEFAKQFVPGSQEHRLANKVKNAEEKYEGDL